MSSIVKGTLKYTCDVLGFIFRSFEELEIETTEPWVEKVIVECRDEKPIEVSVTIASAPSAEGALISSRVICRTIVGRLALRYGLCIQEPILASQSLVVMKDGSTTNVAVGSIPMAISGKDSLSLDSQELAALKLDLEDLRPNKQDYEELYRVAMQSADSVDRYMSLYRILSLLNPNQNGREDQQLVDIFIEQQSADRRIHQRPDKPHIRETIYSKLRNEVGHARPGVDLAVTRQETDVRVYELAVITRKAIELKT